MRTCKQFLNMNRSNQLLFSCTQMTVFCTFGKPRTYLEINYKDLHTAQSETLVLVPLGMALPKTGAKILSI